MAPAACAQKRRVLWRTYTVLTAIVVAWRFADELGGDEGATARARGDVAAAAAAAAAARESGGGVARTLTAAAV